MIVYIAAPYGSSSARGRERNARRAETLARLAVAMGYAPICVHSGVHRGAFGDDGIAAERDAGVEAALELLAASHAVWALTWDDGTLSPGMLRELEHWAKLGQKARAWHRRTWEGWAPLLQDYGIPSPPDSPAKGPQKREDT